MDYPACDCCGIEPQWVECLTLQSFVGPHGEPARVCPRCAANVATLDRELYTLSGAGCCLHVLTDDGNVDDGTADFCIQWAVKAGHTFCEHLARLIRTMPESDRAARWGNNRDEVDEPIPQVWHLPDADTFKACLPFGSRPPLSIEDAGPAWVIPVNDVTHDTKTELPNGGMWVYKARTVRLPAAVSVAAHRRCPLCGACFRGHARKTRWCRGLADKAHAPWRTLYVPDRRVIRLWGGDG